MHANETKDTRWELHAVGGNVFKIKVAWGGAGHPYRLTAHGTHISRRDNSSDWALVHNWDDENAKWRIEIIDN